MSYKSYTLDQTIARYYQLGKKPVPYISTNTTETMMSFYLPIQHGLYDPAHDKMKEKYRKYERAYCVRKKILPELRELEFDLVFDKKGKLIRTNEDEYYEGFYWRLRNLIEANPGRKVACTFSAGFFEEETPIEGHSIIVVYDPAMNTLEFMDSNNLPKQRFRKHKPYFLFCEISNAMMKKIASVLPTQPLFINNDSVYSRYDLGIQSMEASSDLHTESEKEGFCLMWAIFLGDLALTFPEEPIANIIASLKKKSKSKQNSSEYENDYLLQVIRGYVVHITKQLDMSFDDEMSKHQACIRLSS